VVLDTKRTVIELKHRGVIPVEDAVGTRIDCLRGRIWITELGCTDDIVLEADESYEIERDGVAVVQALRDAVVVVRAPTVPDADAARVGGERSEGDSLGIRTLSRSRRPLDSVCDRGRSHRATGQGVDRQAIAVRHALDRIWLIKGWAARSERLVLGVENVRSWDCSGS